jgi:uncharacterized protein (TIRG00374 family)
MTKAFGGRLLASFGLSALFLGVALRQVHFDQVWQVLTGIEPPWVLAYVLSLCLVQGLRALRWGALVTSFAPLTYAQAFRISNVGNMLIMLLPLRLGELSRPYMMRQQLQASFSRTLGAVAVERMLDGLLVSLLFFVTTWSLPASYQVPASLHLGALLALGLFAGVSLLLGLSLYSRDRLFALLERLGGSRLQGLVRKLTLTLQSFLDGLQALPNGRTAAVLLGTTLGYWAVNGLGLWALCCAFGWQLPVACGFILMCVLVIFIMIPAGPGFIGTFQAAIVAGLSIFGISQESAVAYSLVAHVLNLGVVVGFGLPHMLGRQSVDLRSVVQATEGAVPPGGSELR